MIKPLIFAAIVCSSSLFAQVQTPASPEAQQQPSAPGQPKVQVNVLNVCNPSEADTKEIQSALSRIPKEPKFARDFEISRGRSTLSEQANVLQAMPAPSEEAGSPVSDWVRIRHEFGAMSAFANAQYSFTTDEQGAIENLVLRLREPKELVQVSLSDTVTTTQSPKEIVNANTPADRIRLERFGKSSVVLARCPQGDQSKYNYLFDTASTILSNYRAAMNVRSTVPLDMARIAPAPKKAVAKSTETKKSAPPAEKK
ncbi:MAG TPA: hypothetical protein VGL89_05820 [Candidatus Koribacter sp.]